MNGTEYAHGVSQPAARELGTGDLDAFRRAGHTLVDAVADHLAALPARPVWQPLPDDLRAALLALPLPDGPTGLEALAGTMARDVLPHAMGNGHPAFFGWVNSTAGAGRCAGVAAGRGDEPERGVRRPRRRAPRAHGRAVAGGAGRVPARAGRRPADERGIRGDDRLPGRRARPRRRRRGARRAPARARGRPAPTRLRSVRGAQLRAARARAARARQRCHPPLPLPGGRLVADDLRDAIAADRAAGATPALLVGSAGTVNTGAIDPLEVLADVAAAEGLWLHVDGAYGAFGVLDPALAERYRGMERADSLTLDPHNGSASRSTPAARWCAAPTICATRSASSRRTCARTAARRSAPSPSTASSRRGPSVP